MPAKAKNRYASVGDKNLTDRIQVTVSPDDKDRYSKFAATKGVKLAALIRSLLDREIADQ